MARISKPYEVISEKKDKKPVTKISEAQEVILNYMQGLEPTKPVNNPKAAAKKVLIKISGTASSIDPLLPPLKPNHPTHSRDAPTIV